MTDLDAVEVDEQAMDSPEQPAPQFCVYHLFAVDGELLYVGQSIRAAQRLSEHKRTQPWWNEVARIELLHVPDRETMDHVEQRLIQIHNPLHNVTHRGTAGAHWGPYEPGIRQRTVSDGTTVFQARRYGKYSPGTTVLAEARAWFESVKNEGGADFDELAEGDE